MASYDWAPGALLAIAGSFLSWFKSSIQTQDASSAAAKRIDALEAKQGVHDEGLQQTTATLHQLVERVKELRSDLAQHEAENEELRTAVFEELRAAYDRLNTVITQVKVLVETQAVVNKMTADTLQSITDRLEAMAQQINTQSGDIRVLQARGQ